MDKFKNINNFDKVHGLRNRLTAEDTLASPKEALTFGERQVIAKEKILELQKKRGIYLEKLNVYIDSLSGSKDKIMAEAAMVILSGLIEAINIHIAEETEKITEIEKNRLEVLSDENSLSVN